MPLKPLTGLRALALGALAAFLALAASQLPVAQAQLYCWQIVGCTDNAGCGAGGSANRCVLTCNGGGTINCDPA